MARSTVFGWVRRWILLAPEKRVEGGVADRGPGIRGELEARRGKAQERDGCHEQRPPLTPHALGGLVELLREDRSRSE